MNGSGLLLILSLLLPFCSSVRADDASDAYEHLQKGRYAEAEQAYQALLKTTPDSPEFVQGMCRVFTEQGRYEDAQKLLETAIKQSPREAVLSARLAELRFLRGDYEAAEQLCRAAIKLSADQPLAHFILAETYTETGRIKEADQKYVWCVRYYNRAQPGDAETLMLVAHGSLQYARWHSASQIFRFIVNTLCPDALKADKLHWQAAHLSGLTLLEKYNRGQALPEFRDALEINPRAVPVLVALGEAAYQRNDFDNALKYAQRALDVNPNFVPAIWLRADVSLTQGQISKALETLKQAQAVNPHDQRTLARIAACHLVNDGPPEADVLAELLANLDNISEFQSKSKTSTKFIEVVKSLAKQNPRPGYFLNQLAESVENRRQYSVAEQFYKQAIKTMPQLSQPKTSLGMLYARVGRHEEAQKLLDAAFKADPFHVRVSNMRKVLKVLNNYETITTEHFVIHVDSNLDRILGEYMAEYLEEIYPELVKHFGYEPEQRTHFEIYNKAKGLPGHQWFSTRMIGLPWIQTVGASTGVIVAMTSPSAAQKPFNWARVVKHEFVHVITLQQTRFNIPHWFTEALAVTHEGGAGPEVWHSQLLKRVPEGDLFTLANLNNGFIRPESPADWQFAYYQSRLYSKYLSEKYGAESIPKLLTAYRENLPTAEGIKQVTGVDLATFEQGYLDYLKQMVKEMQGGDNTSGRTFEDFKQAYDDNPQDAQVVAEYAYALLQAQQRRQAETIAEKALQLNPKEPLAGYVLAFLDLRAENLEDAVQQLENVLNENQPHPKVLKLLAKIRLAEGNLEEARTLHELGNKFFPWQRHWTKGLAAIALKTDDEPEVIKHLTTLVELEADDGGIRQRLAEIYLKQQNYSKAIHYGKEALYVDVLDVDTHKLLAEAYAATKQTKNAMREYRVIWELDPTQDDAAISLAKLQVDSGEKDKARETLKKLLQESPGHTEAERLLDSL